MKKKTTTEVYTSFADYKKKTYPKESENPLDQGDFRSLGARMAHESLELLRQLLSSSKIVCKQ